MRHVADARTKSAQKLKCLLPWSDFGRGSAEHFSGVEDGVCSQVGGCWSEQLLFSVDQIRGIECGQLKSVTVSNGVCRACFDAVSAKNAAVVIDVVDLCISLGAANAVFGRVLGGFDVNAIGRAIGSAQKTGYALLKPVFIALQHVYAAEALLEAGAS